jgi:dihydrofolate reductase
MSLFTVVAMDQNHGIGYLNQLPWHIPDDLKRFRRLTLNSPIIMGRKTFESIGKPLVLRQNLMLSSTIEHLPLGVQRVTFHECVQKFSERLSPNAYVIGGAQVYEAFLPYCSGLHITMIDSVFPVDTYFPSFEKDFTCVFKQPVGTDFTFTYWVRHSWFVPSQ